VAGYNETGTIVSLQIILLFKNTYVFGFRGDCWSNDWVSLQFSDWKFRRGRSFSLFKLTGLVQHQT